MRFFAVRFDDRARPCLKAEGCAVYRFGDEAVAFRGKILGFGSEEAAIARGVLDRFRAAGLAGISKIAGDFVVGIQTATEAVAFRSLASPHQIYFSKRALSDRLLPACEALALDPEFLRRYLTDVGLPSFYSSLTPIAGVQRLRPGYGVSLREGNRVEQQLVRREYTWVDDSPDDFEASRRGALRTMEEILDDELARIGDRPVVLEISGGLDSALVAGLLARKARNVTGYMYSFPAIASHRATEDRAKAFAAELGVPFQVIAPEELESAPAEAPHPYNDEPSHFDWLGSVFAHSGPRFLPRDGVIFTGTGADSLFNRSQSYLPCLVRDRRWREYFAAVADITQRAKRSRVSFHYQMALGQLPQWMIAKVFSRAGLVPAEVLNPHLMSLRPIDWLRDFRPDRGREQREREAVVGPLSEITDLSYVLGSSKIYGSYLEGHGIEYANPYCDLRLIDFVRRKINTRFIQDWQAPMKHLLREMERGLVPDAIRLQVGKSPFQFDGFLTDYLSRNQAYLRSLVPSAEQLSEWSIDRAKLLPAIDRFHYGDRSPAAFRSFFLLNYLLWWRDFQKHFAAFAQT